MVPDELPLRAIGEMFGVIDREMDRRVHEGITLHEGEWHRQVPGPRTDRISAVPFPDGRIPDEHLARMVEILETQGGDLQGVAASFGCPYSLVERELARYKALNHRYVLSLAASA